MLNGQILAIVRPLGGIELAIPVTKFDVVGGETTTVIDGLLRLKLELFGKFQASSDGLFLVEDEVMLERFSCFIPPAAFFGATVVLPDVIEADGLGCSFPLFVDVVGVNEVPGEAGFGITPGP